MAAEPADDDFESFNIDSQQNQQQAKRIPARRFKSSFCRKGLMLLIFIILSVFLILLIIGVIKSSETNETVEECQSQVQMQVSQALVNVSEKADLKDLELRIRNDVAQMGAKVLATLLKKNVELIEKLSRKLEMLPEPACQDLQCPRHWIHFNGSCYFFSTNKATWNSSNLYCSLRNSNLLVINNANEQHFVTMESNSKAFWIGLTDHVNEANWQWVDGTAYETTPTFWAPGEPNNVGKGEDCIQIDNRGFWNDNTCTLKFLWICEQKEKSA